MQHVEHHLDTGTLRLKPLGLGHFDVDAVVSVGNQVEPQVLEVFLDDDLLAGAVDIADEEVDVALEVAVFGALPGCDEPEVGPAGEAAPVFDPLDVEVLGVLGVGGLHVERVGAVVRLGNHQAAHVLFLEEALEDRCFDLFVAVFSHRL